ncbi:hypothetical protein [Pseudomonas sp.]|uniref:hypothetical protein n=1 Tax=Pseudomonas sp. TaxID=306 RepID=UPI002CFA857E|nr:hypothetical protein [Pseudomonas sp.]HUE93733.1 hypothetical protein [Pseudomonas sp.]
MAKKLAYYSFRYLYASIESLKRDVDFSEAKLSQQLSLYIFAAFTYESFLNHAGHYACQTWDEHLKPKLSPTGKMAFLCEVAKIEPDYGKSPFQTFKKVMELRNELAHAETEYLPYDEEKHANPQNWPKPKWQKIIDHLDANRVIKDLEEIISLVEKALGLTPVPSLLLMEAVELPDNGV